MNYDVFCKEVFDKLSRLFTKEDNIELMCVFKELNFIRIESGSILRAYILQKERFSFQPYCVDKIVEEILIDMTSLLIEDDFGIDADSIIVV